MEEIKVCEICRSVYCGEKCTDPNCEIIALQERIEKLEWAVKYLDSVLLPHQVSDTRRSKIKALLNKGE